MTKAKLSISKNTKRLFWLNGLHQFRQRQFTKPIFVLKAVLKSTGKWKK